LRNTRAQKRCPRLGPQIEAAELGNRGKEELQAYLSEITGFPEREYFRPDFFVNTPGILPFHLQSGEPWIFKGRVALAATLSSNYGIYNGFGLVQYEPIPGKENISTPTNMN